MDLGVSYLQTNPYWTLQCHLCILMLELSIPDFVVWCNHSLARHLHFWHTVYQRLARESYRSLPDRTSIIPFPVHFCRCPILWVSTMISYDRVRGQCWVYFPFISHIFLHVFHYSWPFLAWSQQASHVLKPCFNGPKSSWTAMGNSSHGEFSKGWNLWQLWPG